MTKWEIREKNKHLGDDLAVSMGYKSWRLFCTRLLKAELTIRELVSVKRHRFDCYVVLGVDQDFVLAVWNIHIDPRNMQTPSIGANKNLLPFFSFHMNTLRERPCFLF